MFIFSWPLSVLCTTSTEENIAQSTGAVELFIYHGGRKGKGSVKRVSANMTNQLLSDLPLALRFVKSRPKRGFCRRHEPSLRVNVSGTPSIARAWLDDAWKGAISGVMFRNAPSSSPDPRQRPSLDCCIALCDAHSTDSSSKPSPVNRGRKANATIVGDCVRGSS